MVAYFLIIVVAFTVVGVTLLQLVGDYLFTQTMKEDQRIASSFTAEVLAGFEAKDSRSVYDAALLLCEDRAGRVLVLDRYGVVQVDTRSALNGTRFANAQSVEALTKGKSGYGLYIPQKTYANFWQKLRSYFSTSSNIVGVFAEPLIRADTVVGTVLYITNIRDLSRNFSIIGMRITLWLVIVAIIVLILTVLLIRSLTDPIESLRGGIAKMTAGDFSARIRVRGRDEFAQLGEAFNSMCARLEQLDRSRGQFVSNASHELKTPLSTMKILIESILYQDQPDPEMTKEFLTDVNKEIDRLNRIVSDLLTLANIESNGMNLAQTTVNLGQLLHEQVARLSPLARENGIEIDCELRDEVFVAGDALRLQQVIYNVIDNAIKYTPRGGEVRCTLALNRNGKTCSMRISDTGIGIPPSDLPHVFDRFYRVDKARSRATGGTGLGLSIVRQIVQLHNGTITAQSTEGQGTTFLIELPCTEKKAKEQHP